MIYTYSPKDFNTLKMAAKPGKVFAVIVLAFTALWILYLSVTSQYTSSLELVGFSLFGVCVAYGIAYIMNRSIYKDIKSKDFYLEKGVVEEKQVRKEGVAGSGVLYIPILGKLFPKLYGQKMCIENQYYVVINNTIHHVPFSIFSQIHEREEVNLVFSKCSKVLLDIKKI